MDFSIGVNEWGNWQLMEDFLGETDKGRLLLLPYLRDRKWCCPCMVSQIAVSWRGVRCFWHVVRFGSVGKPAVSVLSGECISARHNFWQRLTTCWGTHLPEMGFPDQSPVEKGELCWSVALRGTAEKALEVILALWLACGFEGGQLTVCSQGRK